MSLRSRIEKIESSEPVRAARETFRKRQHLIDSLIAHIDAGGDTCKREDAEWAIDSYIKELGKLLHLPLSPDERHRRAVMNCVNGL